MVAGAELLEDGVLEPDDDDPDPESPLEDFSGPPDFSPDELAPELFDAESRLSVR